MNKSQQYKEWFNEYSKEWLTDAYEQADYNYPVGYHRLRILLKALENDDLNGKMILDIGCGGGNISFALAQRGAHVIGIDMADSMLEVANSRKAEMMTTLSGTVEFRKENFQDLSLTIQKEKFDYIIAFGLIGYLESDEQFFKILRSLLKENSILYLSCRNELFNVTSVSQNTIKEINTGNIFRLIEEINKDYEKEISPEKSWKFISELSDSINKINSLRNFESFERKDADVHQMKSTARQSTPDELKQTAQEFGYRFCQYWGVHPHLLLPGFNKKLPPRVFNVLSDALCVFEDEPISLVWSSVFIGKFEYRI